MAILGIFLLVSVALCLCLRALVFMYFSQDLLTDMGYEKPAKLLYVERKTKFYFLLCLSLILLLMFVICLKAVLQIENLY